MHLHKGWNTRTPSAWKHCLVQHGGVRPEFSMLVVGVHKSPLVRQVNKAVPIMILKSDCIIDSQTKFCQATLVRVVPMSGLQEEQGTGRGRLLQGGEGRGGGGQRGGGGRGARGRGSARRIGTKGSASSILLSKFCVSLCG